MPFKSDLKAAFVANFTAVPRNRIVNAFASAYGYSATIPDTANPGATLPNPVTSADFAVDKIVEYIQNIVKGEEHKTAQAAVVVANPPTIT